jgi:amidase
MPFVNPQSGPILIEGARKGYVLAVRIDAVRTRGPQPRGTTCLIPEFGGLVATGATALLNPPLPERVRKVDVDERTGVRWSGRITLPYAPFIGTIGVAPEIEAISSLVPDYYGGNMDLPDMGPARSLTSRCRPKVLFSMSATVTRCRATASCAASRSRCTPRSRSRST